MSERSFSGAMPKNVAIIGGSGFIGSHLARKLLDEGYRVKLVDIHRPRLDLPFERADVRDAGALSDALRGVDGVFHLASMIGVENCAANNETVRAINLHGAANVASVCRRNGIRRLLFASSSEVYGDGLKVPFSESDEKRPKSDYGKSKLAAENILRRQAGPELQLRVVRFFNVYGPEQSASFVVRRFVDQALSGLPLTVYGDGRQTRCFTHVTDAVRGAVAAFEYDRSVEATFNIANPYAIQIIDLARMILELVGRRNGIRFAPLGTNGLRSAQIEVSRRVADTALARRLLDFVASVALREGLADLIATLAKSPDDHGSEVPRVALPIRPAPAKTPPDADATDHLYPAMPAVLRYPVYPATPLRFGPRNLLAATRAAPGDLGAELRRRYGASEVALTASGRSALVIALRALGIGADDEVLMASFNCPAVADSILSAGATPVLVDLEEDLSLSRRALRDALTRRSKAVVVSHTFGLPEDDDLLAAAREEGLLIVDDAAQGLLQDRSGRPLGALGDVGVLSFGELKPLAAPGGGALLWFGPPGRLRSRTEGLPVESAAEVRRSYFDSWHRRRAEWLRGSPLSRLDRLWRGLGWLSPLLADKVADFPAAVEIIRPCLMSPLRERLLAGHIRRIEQLREATRRNFLCLRRELGRELAGVRLLTGPREAAAPGYATLLFDDPGARYRCSRHLAERGIQTCWNYYPLHLSDLYQRFGRPAPVTDRLWKRVLSIPFRPPLRPRDMRRIAAAVSEFA